MVSRLIPAVLLLLAGCSAPRNTWSERTAHLDQVFAVDARVDLRLIYRVSGNSAAARTVVLLHGLSCSKASWLPLLDALESEFRVVNIDLLGHGASAKPHPFDYSMSRQAAAVRQLLRALGPADYVLVGTSYGGGIALELAREMEGDPTLRGVAVIGAAALDFPPPPDSSLAQSPLLRFVALYLADSTDLATQILKRSFLRDERIRSDLRDEFAYSLHRYEARFAALEAGAALMREVKNRLEADRYRTITQPVLLIWGDHDKIVPIDVMHRLSAMLPNERTAIIEDCGHITAEECPEATLAVLLPFLRGL